MTRGSCLLLTVTPGVPQSLEPSSAAKKLLLFVSAATAVGRVHKPGHLSALPTAH